MSDTLLVVDAGQTGARIRVVVDGVAQAPIEMPGVRNDTPLVPQWADIVRAALVTFADHSPTQVAVGSTGRGSQHTAAHLLGLLGDTSVHQVAVAHDSVSNYLGALNHQNGVIVAAGTGVIVFGVGQERTWRVDGWGSQLGDSGSGFSIGRAGLEAVMRAHDGRGQQTSLLSVVERDFADIEEAYLEIQNDENWVRRIASYCKTVATLAPTDAVAAAILDNAARELAHSVATAAVKVGETRPEGTLVGTLGGVFRSPELRASFETHLQRALPAAKIVQPLGDALAGAGKLFEVDETSPLRSAISYA
ncbi:MAG: ATPase [Propionibacteriaceae bacterium]|nr:ATPase [Propionibacteriaceae bacterium]